MARGLRAKHTRKHLHFYKVAFGIKETYRILLDGNFIAVAFKQKMDIKVSLCRILQTDKVQTFVTKSVLKELSKLQEQHPEANRFAQNECEIFFSGGSENLSPAEALLQSVIEQNKHHLFVATQDDELRHKLRRMPGVPIILANRTMMLLEAPSDQNVSHGKQMEYQKSSGKSVTEEQELLEKAKAKLKADKEERHSSMVKLRLKKQPKGPNPLSMRKKKRKAPTPPNYSKRAKHAREANDTLGESGKRRRRRKSKGVVAASSVCVKE